MLVNTHAVVEFLTRSSMLVLVLVVAVALLVRPLQIRIGTYGTINHGAFLNGTSNLGRHM
jgi:hypothetical protein